MTLRIMWLVMALTFLAVFAAAGYWPTLAAGDLAEQCENAKQGDQHIADACAVIPK